MMREQQRPRCCKRRSKGRCCKRWGSNCRQLGQADYNHGYLSLYIFKYSRTSCTSSAERGVRLHGLSSALMLFGVFLLADGMNLYVPLLLTRKWIRSIRCSLEPRVRSIVAA